MYSIPLPELPARSVSGLAAWETAEHDTVLQRCNDLSNICNCSMMARLRQLDDVTVICIGLYSLGDHRALSTAVVGVIWDI